MGTPQHKNVYMALAAAQLSMEPVIKGAVNPAFKGEGKPKGTAYADLSDVVSAVRPALAENGLAYFHQMVIFNEAPAMRTVIYHGETDTHVSCDIPLIVAANNMQGMKSATTYAKRIGLESVTGVAPEDDDGNAAAKAPPPKNEPAPRGPSAVDVACDSLGNAASLDQLAEIWKGFPRSVQGEAKVVAAKDAAKARLAPTNADLNGDEIPY